jgi:hypothetical protein
MYMVQGAVQELCTAGESGISIAVNVRDWGTAYPDGVVSVYCTKVDGRAVVLEPTITDGILVAELPAECLSKPGYITVVATVTGGGEKTYKLYIKSTREKAPADYKRRPEWAKEVMVDAEQIRSSLDAALQMHAGLDDAVTAAQTAQGSAEDAQAAAEEAAERAEAVQTDYEEYATAAHYLNELIFNRETTGYGKQITAEEGMTAGYYSLKLHVRTAIAAGITRYVHTYEWVKDEEAVTE